MATIGTKATIYSKASNHRARNTAPRLAARQAERELEGFLRTFRREATTADKHFLRQVLCDWASSEPWREYSLASAFHVAMGHAGDLLIVPNSEHYDALRVYLARLKSGEINEHGMPVCRPRSDPNHGTHPHRRNDGPQLQARNA